MSDDIPRIKARGKRSVQLTLQLTPFTDRLHNDLTLPSEPVCSVPELESQLGVPLEIDYLNPLPVTPLAHAEVAAIRVLIRWYQYVVENDAECFFFGAY